MVMFDRTTKLRWRRRFKRSKRQVEGIGTQAEEHFERHFVKRLARLWQVRRFILTWFLLLALLIGGVVFQTRGLSGYYKTTRPVPGGTFVEGIVGSFTNADPLYATASVDGAVSELIFAGLFKHDQNNQLVGDLAEKYEVDARGAIYTVTLKPGLEWHDGRPLTAHDVVFTYQTIQHPDARSPLANSWRDIAIQATDNQTVVFTLPNALSAFPNAMTNGIVPKHLLDGIPKTQLRSIAFNTSNPVGSGPFKWETIEVVGETTEEREERIALVANKDYHGGTPKLNRFILRVFRTDVQLINSFRNRELTAMAGLELFPPELSGDETIYDYNIPLTGAVMVFFNTKNEFLSNPKLRQALVMATDQTQIIQALQYPAIPVKSPLLRSHIGYDPALTQLGYSHEGAAKLLDEAGWALGIDGFRSKDGRRLAVRLLMETNQENELVVAVLQKQWQAVGVDLQIQEPLAKSDLQTLLVNRPADATQFSYDILLSGIALGLDPDVFAYWHSSQADIRSPSRLNFSDYHSTVADNSLAAGRTRDDPTVKSVKYKPFLEAWRNDAPAIGLYQPRLLYVTRGQVAGFPPRNMNSSVDRYANVENWMIRYDHVVK